MCVALQRCHIWSSTISLCSICMLFYWIARTMNNEHTHTRRYPHSMEHFETSNYCTEKGAIKEENCTIYFFPAEKCNAFQWGNKLHQKIKWSVKIRHFTCMCLVRVTEFSFKSKWHIDYRKGKMFIIFFWVNDYELHVFRSSKVAYFVVAY